MVRIFFEAATATINKTLVPSYSLLVFLPQGQAKKASRSYLG